MLILMMMMMMMINDIPNTVYYKWLYWHSPTRLQEEPWWIY